MSIVREAAEIDDERIVNMIFKRDEDGLLALKNGYGAYIRSILRNILRNRLDEEECFNDVLMAVWSSIPPAKPQNLKSYLGAISRNTAINRYEKQNAQKRAGSTEELIEEIVSLSGDDDPEGELMAKSTSEEINAFLSTLNKQTRICFVLRYYFAASIDEIAEKTGKNPHAVTALLSKTRSNLKKYLKEHGSL